MEDDFREALTFVREGGKIREAERIFNVPHWNLINKLKDRVHFARKMIPSTDEEEILRRWIMANDIKGIPLNKRVLIETVGEILKGDSEGK